MLHLGTAAVENSCIPTNAVKHDHCIARQPSLTRVWADISMKLSKADFAKSIAPTKKMFEYGMTSEYLARRSALEN